jgi:VCBS repeat-containing protein
VSAVNDAPVANDTSVATNESTAVTISLSAADIDSAGLSFGLVAGPSNGTLGGISAANCTPSGSGSVCTATVTYTPAASFNGNDTFAFKANDADLDSNVATVGITVNAVNDPPIANNDAYSIAENMPLNIGAPGVLGNDTDVDDAQNTLTAVLVSGPARAGSFSLNPDGSFSYVPTASFSGTDIFTYIAQDPHGAQSNVATVAIAINPVNDAPLANNATATTNSGTAVNITLSASDIDSTGLAFAVTSGPSH